MRRRGSVVMRFPVLLLTHIISRTVLYVLIDIYGGKIPSPCLRAALPELIDIYGGKIAIKSEKSSPYKKAVSEKDVPDSKKVGCL